MKLLLAGLVLVLIVETQAQWYRFPIEAAQGARDMWRAYSDMREANLKDSAQYFHDRGHQDATNRGPGGAWIADVISNARDRMQGGSRAWDDDED